MTTDLAQLAQRPTKPTTPGEMVQALRPEIQRALPKHLNADRMARLALTMIRKDKALAKCSPESFAGALLTAAALGLEPGVNGEAYLVAYSGECTLIVGYQGYTKLFWQSPLAKHIDAQAVYENDVFDYEYGLHPNLTHKPAKGDRGKITHYYGAATLTTGASAFVVLTEAEVSELRKGSRRSNIADPMHWMERKTALRQLIKLLPKSAELQQAIKADEKTGAELHAEQVAAKAIEAPANVNTETGEVIDGELMDEPYDPTLEPGFGGQR